MYSPTSSESPGTFSWKIDFSGITGGPDSADMFITPILTGGTNTYQSSGIDLTDNNLWAPDPGTNAIASVPLIEGYYWVDFEIELDPQDVTFRQVLHIYRGMTSHFEHDFDDDHFALLNGQVSAGTISIGTGGNVNQGVLPVLGDDTGTAISSVTIVRGQTEVITVTNFSEYDDIDFYFNSKTPTTDGLGNYLTGTGNQLTINTAVGQPYADLTARTYHLTVVGWIGSGGSSMPNSTVILVEIEEP